MNTEIPLCVPLIQGNEWQYIKECLDTGWVSSAGSYVGRFEKEVANYTGAKYTVATVNGTSALYISLIICGIQPRDEVIVPTLTFIAPVNTVKYLHAEPIFMDCDNYMNMDPEKLGLFCKYECKLTKSGLKNKKSGRIIKAIMPVHVFGNPCNLAEIMKVAKKYNLKIIEDATESLGAYYTGGIYKGRFTGTIGELGVYSFNGNKIVTAGAGGMIVTNSKKLAMRAKYLSNQAKDNSVRSIHNEIGYNFRLTSLQAALGIAQLEKLDGFLKIKKRNYELYRTGLRGVKGIKIMEVPENTSPNYWFYSLIIDRDRYGLGREQLMEELKRVGIETRPIWHLNHLQKPFINNQAYKIEKSLWFLKRVLNIPCSTNLTEKQINKILSAIKRLKNKNGKT